MPRRLCLGPRAAQLLSCTNCRAGGSHPSALWRPPLAQQAHAGFATAWLHADFNKKVLARLRALDAARPEGSAPLRIWITGGRGGPRGAVGRRPPEAPLLGLARMA